VSKTSSKIDFLPTKQSTSFSAMAGISKCESNIPQLFHIVEELFVRVHLRLMQAKGT